MGYILFRQEQKGNILHTTPIHSSTDIESCQYRKEKNMGNNAEACRKWRKANPEKYKAGWKRWRDAHPEKVKEYNRRQYERRKALKLAAQKGADTDGV